MIASDIARSLGVTRQAVSKLKKRGMPVHDLEEAKKWRAIHCAPRGKVFTVPTTEATPSPFDDALDRVGRARAAEQFAYSVLRDAAASKDVRLTGRALRDFLAATKKAAEAEQAAVAAGMQSKELLRARDIEEQFDLIVRPFLHRCEMAEKNEKCRWYVTVEGAAKDMKDTLRMFFNRLTPRDLFTDEKAETQTH
jgi:hypothetical protein